MLVQFERWDCDDSQTYFINPAQVDCVREYRDRKVYAGQEAVSELFLRTGDKVKVVGHVAERIKSWQHEIEAHPLDDRDSGRTGMRADG